ncbi:MAG: hypothetical protein IRY83_14235 [Chloroflexi bacterium]|nr:hypothetical protein [Chloroflexota bacterium]
MRRRTLLAVVGAGLLQEIRLHARSAGFWVVLVVSLMYAVPETVRAHTFLRVATAAGGWLRIILPIGMGFVWVTSATRDRRFWVEELEAATPTPTVLLRTGRLMGGLALALVIGVLSATIAIVASLVVSRPTGLPGDMAILGLWVAGPLFAWWAACALVSRLPGVWPYVAILALGAISVTSRGPYSPSFAPFAVAETVIVTPDEARTLLVHRALCLAAGAAIVAASATRGRGSAVWCARGLVVAVALLLAAASFPGWTVVRSAVVTQEASPDWAERAELSGRWTLSSEQGLDVWLSRAHAGRHVQVARTVAALRSIDGGTPEELTVVEVPDDVGPHLAGTTLLVPERVFRDGASDAALRQRLVEAWTFAHEGMSTVAADLLYGRYYTQYVQWVYASRIGSPDLAAEIAQARTRHTVAAALWDRFGDRVDPVQLEQGADRWLDEAYALFRERASSGGMVSDEAMAATAVEAFERAGLASTLEHAGK